MSLTSIYMGQLSFLPVVFCIFSLSLRFCNLLNMSLIGFICIYLHGIYMLSEPENSCLSSILGILSHYFFNYYFFPFLQFSPSGTLIRYMLPFLIAFFICLNLSFLFSVPLYLLAELLIISRSIL